MGKVNWQHIESILDHILELPKKEWSTFLDANYHDQPDIRNELESMLESITESEGWLENPEEYRTELYPEINNDLDSKPLGHELIGQTVGAYTIKKVIGEGGMGTVYLGEREVGKYKHQVAIKIIPNTRATERNLKRFEQEQQILAKLNHPGIAQLYDIGISEQGFPYIIMEYVNGIPITEYCKRNKYSLRDKITLFIEVLKAVRYAHENLTIHRDLKPDNILVDKAGNIKILDFGISKLMDKDSAGTLTETGFRYFTFKYAAPEQVQQKNTTTATDTYSLGVILYRLITDCYPYDLANKTRYEMERVILEEPPKKPTAVLKPGQEKSEIRGDLEAILLKSLRKEPEFRYRVANEFISDLQNFFDDLPVSAQEDSIYYRLQKFSIRHSKSMAVTTGLIMLLIGLIGFYTVRITEERNQAQIEAQKNQQIADFLTQLFEASDPMNNLGNSFTTIELLKNGVNEANKLTNQPLVQAQLFNITGQVYRNIGMYEESEELIQKAIRLYSDRLGENDTLTLSSFHNLGLVRNDMGEYHSAGKIFKDIYEKRKALLGAHHPKTASSLANLAYSERRAGKYKTADSLARMSLSIFLEELGPEHPQTLDVMNKLAINLHNKGDYEEAKELYINVLEARRNLLGPIHPDIAKSINNLAMLYLNTGKFNEAEKLLLEAKAMHIKMYGKNHPNVALVTNNLGLVAAHLNQFDKADSLYRTALSMRKELLGMSHTNTAVSIYTIAHLKLDIQQPDSAIYYFNKAYDIFSKELSPQHSFSLHSKFGIGRALMQKNDPETAKSYFEESYNSLLEIHQPGSIEYALATYHYGEFLSAFGDQHKGMAMLETAVEALTLIEGEDGPRTKIALQTLQSQR